MAAVHGSRSAEVKVMRAMPGQRLKLTYSQGQMEMTILTNAEPPQHAGRVCLISYNDVDHIVTVYTDVRGDSLGFSCTPGALVIKFEPEDFYHPSVVARVTQLQEMTMHGNEEAYFDQLCQIVIISAPETRYQHMLYIGVTSRQYRYLSMQAIVNTYPVFHRVYVIFIFVGNDEPTKETVSDAFASVSGCVCIAFHN